jgi:hypothetical protein
MKKNIVAGILILSALIVVHSCDKIEPPYREANAGIAGTNDSTVIINGDTIIFPADASTTVQKILGEDYTGHLCGNCPDAGLLMDDTMKSIYGDRLVIVSVHAGSNALPCPDVGAPCPGTAAPPGAFSTNFINATGTDWDNFFGISAAGNPNGMIDRKGYPASNIVRPDNWAARIQTEAALSPDIKIRIINHYNATTHELKTAVQAKFLANTTGTYKLQVVLTEDSIVDWQEWDPPHAVEFDSTYVQRYVLRGGMNGSFGAVIADGSQTPGTIKINGFSYSLNSNWNASHCKVVAFVYDAANYGVQQVEEKVIQ